MESRFDEKLIWCTDKVCEKCPEIKKGDHSKIGDFCEQLGSILGGEWEKKLELFNKKGAGESIWF